jgi:hypothetical protein
VCDEPHDGYILAEKDSGLYITNKTFFELITSHFFLYLIDLYFSKKEKLAVLFVVLRNPKH